VPHFLFQVQHTGGSEGVGVYVVKA
jgi:hypothetical protein